MRAKLRGACALAAASMQAFAEASDFYDYRENMARQVAQHEQEMLETSLEFARWMVYQHTWMMFLLIILILVFLIVGVFVYAHVHRHSSPRVVQRENVEPAQVHIEVGMDGNRHMAALAASLRQKRLAGSGTSHVNNV